MTDLEKDKILLLAHSVGKMARELQSIKRLLKEIADTPQTDCETCRHYKLTCELFSEVCKYEPITQIETQNSNLTFETLEYCDICDHKGCEECISNALDEHCMPSQFKKQIEDECAKEYEELGLKELKGLIKADHKTENCSEKPNNSKERSE